ncbi:MAG: amidase [Rhizobiaceae bacterium]
MTVPAKHSKTPRIHVHGESIEASRDAIINGRSTVAQEISACRARIEALNAELAAFEIIAGTPTELADPSLPLAGISVGVKDLYDTADMVTSYGSPIYRHHAPATDAALVTRLRNLGAFIAGKTVTTEFAWRQAGPTVNPWNPAHTPGGSSSGSAAAVAAGIVPVAIGTQTFGSIIRPAAFCGVVGFKPTYGILPLEGVCPLSPTLDHAGLFARSVADISSLFGLLSGQPLPTAKSGRPPRLRMVRGPFWSQASAQQRETLETAAIQFAHMGASITERELPSEFEEGFATAETILIKEAAGLYGPLIERSPELVSVHIKDLAKRGLSLREGDFEKALAFRDQLQAAFKQEMEGYDAILTLPALGEAPLLAEGTGNAGPCAVWTLLGAPAIALPRTTGADNLPLGLQLVGSSGGDASLLATAAWCGAANQAEI